MAYNIKNGIKKSENKATGIGGEADAKDRKDEKVLPNEEWKLEGFLKMSLYTYLPK